MSATPDPRVAQLRRALREVKDTIRVSDSPYELDAHRGYLLDLIDDVLYETNKTHAGRGRTPRPRAPRGGAPDGDD